MNTEVRKLARLEERLTRAGAIAARQQEGPTAVGSVAAKDRAELAERFKLPNSNATNSSFVTSVKALIAVAEEHRPP